MLVTIASVSRMLSFVCLFAIASLASASTANVSLPMDEENPLTTPTPLIVNGRAYDISEVPYQVSMQYKERKHICGGSIIGPKHILTAAHCLTGKGQEADWDFFTIRAGSSIYNAGGQVIKISRFHLHQNYNPDTFNYDIAVLELAENIVMGSNTKVVTLPSDGSPVPIGSHATASGWGLLREEDEDRLVPTQLQGVSIPIQDPSICELAYIDSSPFPFDRNTMICAASIYGGQSTCKGDSGGPLVVNGVQYGIVSWGAGCARRGKPALFAHVANLRQFITQYTHGI